MRTVGSALVGAAALLVVSAPGHAQQQQDPIAEAATKLYSSCITNIGGTPAECGCVTGFFAAHTKEDEFRILATLIPFLDSKGAVTDEAALIRNLTAERTRIGMSEQRFGEVMDGFQKMDALGEEADRYCVPVGLKSDGK
jgi:hypothetical protein